MSLVVKEDTANFQMYEYIFNIVPNNCGNFITRGTNLNYQIVQCNNCRLAEVWLPR